MKKPKVVLIGAGSLFFARQAIWAMNHLEGLRGGTLALVDCDAANLNRMVRLAELVSENTGSGLTVEGSLDCRDVLAGADFVILSFADRNAHFRKIDCEVSEKYGIRMCSGDSIGPGGVFRAARELPVILRIAKEIEEICPEAWVINYINPSAVNGIGLMRHTKLKSFALCDGHYPVAGFKRNYMELAGLDPKVDNPDDFKMNIAGINHFSWAVSITYRGEDMAPRIRKSWEEKSKGERDEGYAKSRFNATYGKELYDLFGCIPTIVSHTKEYVPYWQGHNVAPSPHVPLSIFDCEERVEITRKMWEEVDAYLEGSKPIEEFNKQTKSDIATDIVEAMWTGSGGPFYLSTANGDAVGNLPPDAFLELLCDVSMEGPKPRKVGDMPLGLRGLQMQVLDTHELTVEGIVKKDITLLRRALVTDPIVNTIADADAVLEEILEKEADVLGYLREPVAV